MSMKFSKGFVTLKCPNLCLSKRGVGDDTVMVLFFSMLIRCGCFGVDSVFELGLLLVAVL